MVDTRKSESLKKNSNMEIENFTITKRDGRSIGFNEQKIMSVGQNQKKFLMKMDAQI